MQNGITTSETTREVSSKVNHTLTMWPSNSIHRYVLIQEKGKDLFEQRLVHNVHSRATNFWKQPNVHQ